MPNIKLTYPEKSEPEPKAGDLYQTREGAEETHYVYRLCRCIKWDGKWFPTNDENTEALWGMVNLNNFITSIIKNPYDCSLAERINSEWVRFTGVYHVSNTEIKIEIKKGEVL